MRELQIRGVKFDREGGSVPARVEGVTDDRVSEGREVGPDLVRAAGVQCDCKQGLVRSPFENSPVRDRRLPGGDHAAPVVERRVEPERSIDGSGIIGDDAFDERAVGPRHRSLSQLLAKCVMHGRPFGDGDESVGAAVESVGGIWAPGSPVVTWARAGVPQ